MSRELWFLRHGEAEPGDDGRDEERALTRRGEHQAAVAGEAMASMGLRFSAVLTSPRVRAAQTARLACEPLGDEPVEHEPLSGGFDRDEALALIQGQDDGARVLVVGHEPDFSQTVRDLTGARIALDKGGLVGVAIESGEGELVALMGPTQLEALAD